MFGLFFRKTPLSCLQALAEAPKNVAPKQLDGLVENLRHSLQRVHEKRLKEAPPERRGYLDGPEGVFLADTLLAAETLIQSGAGPKALTGLTLVTWVKERLTSDNPEKTWQIQQETHRANALATTVLPFIESPQDKLAWTLRLEKNERGLSEGTASLSTSQRSKTLQTLEASLLQQIETYPNTSSLFAALTEFDQKRIGSYDGITLSATAALPLFAKQNDLSQAYQAVRWAEEKTSLLNRSPSALSSALDTLWERRDEQMPVEKRLEMFQWLYQNPLSSFHKEIFQDIKALVENNEDLPWTTKADVALWSMKSGLTVWTPERVWGRKTCRRLLLNEEADSETRIEQARYFSRKIEPELHQFTEILDFSSPEDSRKGVFCDTKEAQASLKEKIAVYNDLNNLAVKSVAQCLEDQTLPPEMVLEHGSWAYKSGAHHLEKRLWNLVEKAPTARERITWAQKLRMKISDDNLGAKCINDLWEQVQRQPDGTPQGLSTAETVSTLNWLEQKAGQTRLTAENDLPLLAIQHGMDLAQRTKDPSLRQSLLEWVASEGYGEISKRAEAALADPAPHQVHSPKKSILRLVK